MTSITARITAELHGRRIYRTQTFILSSPYVERDFVPAGDNRPAQSRIFARGPHGESEPVLVLTEDVPADMLEHPSLNQGGPGFTWGHMKGARNE